MSAPLDRSRVPRPGPLRPFHFPEVRRARTSNGVEVIVAESHAFPVATVDLVFPSGGLAEPASRGGVAALTTGLLESGGDGRSAAEVAEAVDALGMSLETGVSWDSSLAGATSLSSQIGPAVELLTGITLRPSFPEEEVARIRDERLATLAHRRSDPGELADELLGWFTFPPDHPFARRLGGWRRTLGALAREDVAAFHAARYRPEGAAFCVAGDVTLDAAVALAERHLSGWTGGADPVPRPEPRNRVERTTIFLADRPGSVQSELRVGHPGISRTAEDFFAVTVMNAILGGLFSSRLNYTLRERLGITYGARSSFIARVLPGTFAASSAVQVEGTARAVSEILGEMRRLQEERVSEGELDDARSYLAGTFPLGLQTSDGVSARLAALAVYDLPDDHFHGYRDRLLAVTADEVRDAAARRLFPGAAAVVVVGDAARLRPELEALGVGAVEPIDPETTLG